MIDIDNRFHSGNNLMPHSIEKETLQSEQDELRKIAQSSENLKRRETMFNSVKFMLIISMVLLCTGCDEYALLPNSNNATIPANIKRIADSLEKISVCLEERTKEKKQ